eukprot:TRINITY_DN347_c0_g1_i3.p1 TRINITY_DN347_c0_g1~~TRINITY_DN347_c0_g1_i3.p1  ORF type:complete len:695 (+),score=240.14 TRINITY_DN347_c0_g1_i3:108-2192(+)
MKTSFVAVCFVLFAGVAQAAAPTNPISKVILLIKEFTVKVTNDGQASDVAFAKRQTTCATSKQALERSIKNGESKIESLGAKIAKAQADADTAGQRIDELTATLSQTSSDADAAKKVREVESAQNKKGIAELVDTVDMLSRAANLLKDRLGKGSLLQKQANIQDDEGLVNALQRVMDAAAFPVEKQESLLSMAKAKESQAPVKKAYESRSGNIIDVLLEMRQEARKNLEELRTEERAQQSSYDLLKASLDDKIKITKAEIEESQGEKASAQEVEGAAQAQQNQAKATLAEDQKSLADLVQMCETDASDHEEEVKTRTEELAALAKAEEVLIATTGNSENQLYKAPPAFVQLASVVHRLHSSADLVNDEVVDLVRRLGEQTSSTALTQLAGQIESVMALKQPAGPAAVNDPFAKVKDLINQMIEKLRSESKNDQKHHDYCEKEQKETKAKIKKLTGKSERLNATSDMKVAEMEALKVDIAQLNDEVTAILKEQSRMDAERTEQKAVFTTFTADLNQGLEGVRLATQTLNDFYNKETSLLQVNSKSKKSKAPANGIFEMLEVVESDISKNLVEAQNEEDMRVEDYEKISKDNTIERSTKEQGAKYKGKAVTQLEKALSNVRADQQSNGAELDAATEYKKNLDEQCANKKETYEEQKERQEKQLTGLKEALEVLRSGAVFLQKKSSGHLRGDIKKHF